MNTAMHKKCYNLYSYISIHLLWKRSQHTFVSICLKIETNLTPFFLVPLLNAISFKHTTQASLTAQNPHTSTTIHCLQKLSNRRPRSPQLCSTPHPSTPHPILTTYPPHTPPSPSPPKMWVAWEASSNWRKGPNLPWLENLSHLQQTFSSLLKYELTREQSSTRK